MLVLGCAWVVGVWDRSMRVQLCVLACVCWMCMTIERCDGHAAPEAVDVDVDVEQDALMCVIACEWVVWAIMVLCVCVCCCRDCYCRL